MAEERITQTEDHQGNTHTTHIVSDSGSEGGSTKWMFLIVLALALGVGAYLLSQGNAAEIAKDNAIAEAANEVGEAAGQVGEAAEGAAAEVEEAAQDVSETVDQATSE